MKSKFLFFIFDEIYFWRTNCSINSSWLDSNFWREANSTESRSASICFSRIWNKIASHSILDFFTSKTKQQQKSGNRWGFSFNSYANTVEPYVTESEFGSFCVPLGPKSYSIGSFAVFLKSCVPPVNRSPIPEVYRRLRIA